MLLAPATVAFVVALQSGPGAGDSPPATSTVGGAIEPDESAEGQASRWNAPIRRTEIAMVGAGTAMALGLSITVAGLALRPQRCFKGFQCREPSVPRLIGAGTLLGVASAGVLAATLGMRQTMLRARDTGHRYTPRERYRRLSWIAAGSGIVIGLGAAVAAADAVTVPLSTCDGDNCEGHVFFLGAVVGGPLVAAGLIGLTVSLAKRSALRKNRTELSFFGSGVSGRF